MNTNGKERGHPPLPASRLTSNGRVAKTKDLQAALKEDMLVGKSWDHRKLLNKLDRPALNEDLLLLAEAVEDQLAEVWSEEDRVKGFKAVHDVLAEQLDQKQVYHLKGIEAKVADRLESTETEILGRIMKVLDKKLSEAISTRMREMVGEMFAPLIAEATDDFNREFGEKLSEMRQLGAEMMTTREEIEKYINGLQQVKSLLENIQIVVPPETIVIKQLPSVVNFTPPAPQRPSKKTIEYDDLGRPLIIREEPAA